MSDYKQKELKRLVNEAFVNADVNGYADELERLTDRELACDLLDFEWHLNRWYAAGETDEDEVEKVVAEVRLSRMAKQ